MSEQEANAMLNIQVDMEENDEEVEVEWEVEAIHRFMDDEVMVVRKRDEQEEGQVHGEELTTGNGGRAALNK